MIRPIQPAEGPQARDVYFRVMHAFYHAHEPFDAVVQTWLDDDEFPDLADVVAYYNAPGHQFLVCDVGDRLVGTAAFRRFAEDPASGEVKRVALLPEYRGQGLGLALMQALLSAMRAQGYARAVLWSDRDRLTRAVSLYRQLGFVEGSRPGAEPGEIWMTLDLQPDVKGS